MAAAGLPAYEVSNHARLAQESRHNLAYWRYHDYAGIGPGAHGRRLGHATVRHRKPENWMSAIAAQAQGIDSDLALTPAERAKEALVMGLRLAEGVDLERVAERSGVAVGALVDLQKVEALARNGLVARAGARLKVLPAGMLLLDAILAEIVAV